MASLSSAAVKYWLPSHLTTPNQALTYLHSMAEASNVSYKATLRGQTAYLKGKEREVMN